VRISAPPPASPGQLLPPLHVYDAFRRRYLGGFRFPDRGILGWALSGAPPNTDDAVLGHVPALLAQAAVLFTARGVGLACVGVFLDPWPVYFRGPLRARTLILYLPVESEEPAPLVAWFDLGRLIVWQGDTCSVDYSDGRPVFVVHGPGCACLPGAGEGEAPE